MDPETATPTRETRLKLYWRTLGLALQSFGIVYGDLSTSPIYVYSSTFSRRLQLHEEDDEILGVLSLVFWTLTLIPLCKYVIFVLRADDNGEGGTFALYSLLCCRAKIGLLNASHGPDEEPALFLKETRTSSVMKDFFDKHHNSRIILLLVVLLGTSMVISDGVLTPSMSVLAAVYGIKTKAETLHENYAIFITCLILAGLFALQHFGTHRVGFLFAPIILSWLLCISGIGLYNIIKWNPSVVSALSPYYVYNLFKKTRGDGWNSLGGVVLCVTGSEAMFADLGHFSQFSIRIAFTAVVYPCLILAYMGEAAYLSKHKQDLERSFYKAIPEAAFWPVFIIATLATVVGSQAVISATFSIISQCRALRCFPRVKVTHTSDQVHGQIYIPEVNWILMVLCLIVVIGLRDINTIGNAYGLAVITVMLVTTCLMFFVIVMVWKHQILAAFAFVIVFGSIESLYFSACITNVHEGGWLLLILSVVVFTTMCIWHYGTSKKQTYELENKICLETLLSLGPNLGINRVPGIGLVYTNVMSGVPPMFSHFITNFPAFHRVLIFVTFQYLTVPKDASNQRFIVSRIGPPEFRFYRCTVRIGYKDVRKDIYSFESHLIESVVEFLQHDGDNCDFGSSGRDITLGALDSSKLKGGAHENGAGTARKMVRFRGGGCIKELKDLDGAREAGLAYMVGNTHVMARETSSYLKKFIIDILYGFLRRNCRSPATALGIPHTSLIEVGMVYHV